MYLFHKVNTSIDARKADLLLSHRVGGNRKRSQQSTNADQISIETVFSIAICRQCGDKWQTKTLFLAIFLSMFLDSIGVFDLPPTRCNYSLSGNYRLKSNLLHVKFNYSSQSM